jgi:thiamine-monophosphate kinase
VAGDELYVTGALGGAAAGLLIRQTGNLDGDVECLRRYERPTPQLRTGRLVARSRTARSAIDLSDGLADGARQLAAAAGLGVEIDAEAVPILPAAAVVAASAGRDALDLAPRRRRGLRTAVRGWPRQRRGFLSAVGRAGVVATLVGRLVEDRGAILVQSACESPFRTDFHTFNPFNFSDLAASQRLAGFCSTFAPFAG